MEKGGLAARLKAVKRAVEPSPALAPSASAADATTPLPAAPTPAPAADPSAPAGEACDELPEDPVALPLPDALGSLAVDACLDLPRFQVPEPRAVGPASDLAPASQSATPPSPLDVWFWDEMRLGLHGQVRRVWAPIGEKVEQRLQIVYTWIYLVLAVNPVRGEVRAQWVANLKGPTLAPVLTEWFGAEPQAVVVWDGAPGHRNHVVQATGVRTVLLPPYSPELDPAERVFRAIRPEVEGLVYANLAAKQALVDDWLRTFAADAKRVRAMIAWSWLLEQIQMAS